MIYATKNRVAVATDIWRTRGRSETAPSYASDYANLFRMQGMLAAVTSAAGGRPLTFQAA